MLVQGLVSVRLAKTASGVGVIRDGAFLVQIARNDSNNWRRLSAAMKHFLLRSTPDDFAQRIGLIDWMRGTI